MSINRFAGRCWRCGAKVAANTGSGDRAAGTAHADGQCKTTTKTYRQWQQAEAMTEFRAASTQTAQ